MDTAAFYHRPESEYAYLYEKDLLHIRLRTKTGDVEQVNLFNGDTYLLYTDHWYQDPLPMKKIARTDLHDYWGIEMTLSTKRVAYGFHIIGKDETEVFYCDRGVFPLEERFLNEVNYYFRMPYFHEVDRFKSPQWVKETIWYQIFPDRFANGDPSINPEGVLPWASKKHPDQNDYYGGDLQGIIDKLDYLEDLGVNGLYLTPIFEAKTNHKYDTIDYKKIDPTFGDEGTLKKLIEKAHGKGIRIMFDAVFNHIGYYSKQWQDVLEHQENSRYKDWFHIHSFPVDAYKHLSIGEMNNMENLNYDTFGFVGHMPKLNTANPEVKAHLLDVATYWIREFDIDAWRLDVANEVDHQFWKEFHAACIDEKEDFYIIGEIWHSAKKWLEGDEFHAVMNYAFTEKIEDYFLKKIITPKQLVHGLNLQLMLYRQQVNEVQFNLLDSHDTARLLTRANGDKDLVKAILTFMFAQQGTPCLYYGTEIGMAGNKEPDSRKCMIWDEDKQDLGMFNFTKELIRLRKAYQPILSYGELHWHDIRDAEDVVGFKRIYDKQTLAFYFNQGQEVATVKIPENAEVVFSHLVEKKARQALLHENGFLVILQ